MNNSEVIVRPDASTHLMENQETEIDLVELFYALLRSYKLILLFVIACTLAAGLYTRYVAVPMYESTAKLYVLNSKDSALNLSDLQIGSYLTNDYQQVFNTWEVHEQVRQNLGLDYSYKKMQSMLRVENPANTRILHVTVRSNSPDEAKAMANEFAAVAQQYISETMQTEKPSILSEALKPLYPSSPSMTKNLAIGFFLGLAISGGIVLVRFMTDDKIKTTEDISRYAGLSTLAVVPVHSRADVLRMGAPGGGKKKKAPAARGKRVRKAAPTAAEKTRNGEDHQ